MRNDQDQQIYNFEKGNITTGITKTQGKKEATMENYTSTNWTTQKKQKNSQKQPTKNELVTKRKPEEPNDQ